MVKFVLPYEAAAKPCKPRQVVRLLSAATLALIPSIAHAQAPQAPAYVPITISEQDWTKLQTYLGDQPAKFSNPVIGFLNQMEQVAVIKATSEVAKAKASAAKPADVAVPPVAPHK